MNIHELSKKAYEIAKAKGFYDEMTALDNMVKNFEKYQLPETHGMMELNKRFKYNAIAAKLDLLHAEVSEATEALRKEDMVNFAEELADVIIYTMSLSVALNIDIEDEIVTKMAKNEDRPTLNGKAF